MIDNLAPDATQRISSRIFGDAGQPSRRILYLSEAGPTAEAFKRRASLLGYEVEHVESAGLALALIADLDPGLLVIDRYHQDVTFEDICDALRIPREIHPLALLVTDRLELPEGGDTDEWGVDAILSSDLSADSIASILAQQSKVTWLQRRIQDRENEILDTMPNSLIEIDTDTVLWKANRSLANLLEIDDPMFRREMLGKPLGTALARCTEHVPQETIASLVGTIQQAIREQKKKFRCKDVVRGGERVFAGIITPLTQENTHYLVELRDATEEEQAVMVEARRERLATIGNLAVGAAHEIQNPNTFSRVNASNLKQLIGALKPVLSDALTQSGTDKLGTMPIAAVYEKIDSAISGVETASRRIEAVISTLKTFGRTSDGAVGAVNPRGAIDEAILLAQHEARDKAELKVELPEELSTVKAEAAELSQVFLNLIQNAIKAFDLPGTQARGSGPAIVRVHVDSTTRHDLVIAVTDNGPGIEPKMLERIFRPYYTTRKQGEGLGLGLSISSDIMHRFGGDLTVRSQPGQGASFLVGMKRADDSELKNHSSGDR